MSQQVVKVTRVREAPTTNPGNSLHKKRGKVFVFDLSDFEALGNPRAVHCYNYIAYC